MAQNVAVSQSRSGCEYLYDLATGQDEPETPQEFVRDLFFSRPVDER